jgi:acyl carrier protein
VATVPAGADVDGAPGKEPVSAAQEAVLATVVSLITDVIGEEYAAGLDIGMQTTFQEDLELESIEFTALAERLIDTYGERVDFMGWLAEMDVDAIIAMTVGELVEFIAASGAAGQAD